MDVITQVGKVTIAAEGITISKSLASLNTLLRKQRFIPREQIAGVTVHDGSRYMTRARATGAVLTGGLALLAPRQRNVSLIIVLTDGEILTLRLTVPRQAQGVAIFAESLGYAS
jgi:hypothetical protein